MKPISYFIFCLWMGALTGCQYTAPAPSDPLIQTAWSTGNVTYSFEAGGSFRMIRGKTGEVWGGSWSYLQNRTELEINLHYGPNNLIQIIRLRGIQCTETKMTARWTDEIAQDIPLEWQACKRL